MKVLVRLDLSKYTIETVKRLYAERIISKEEFVSELKERGMNDLVVLTLTREVA